MLAIFNKAQLKALNLRLFRRLERNEPGTTHEPCAPFVPDAGTGRTYFIVRSGWRDYSMIPALQNKERWNKGRVYNRKCYYIQYNTYSVYAWCWDTEELIQLSGELHGKDAAQHALRQYLNIA